MTPSTTNFRIPEEKPTMSIPNRLTLDAVPATPIGEIAALPAEQLALLQLEAAEELANAKRLKDWLDSGIDLKYRDRAADSAPQRGQRYRHGTDRGRRRGRRCRSAEEGRLGPS